MEREEFQGSDYDRPLTPSGREKTQKAMTGLLEVIKDNQERPVLFSSGALRAKQTAEVFAGGKAHDVVLFKRGDDIRRDSPRAISFCSLPGDRVDYWGY